MGEGSPLKIVLAVLDRLWAQIMNNRILSLFVVGLALFLLGAVSIYAFTEFFGFQRLRSESGAGYVISFLIVIFSTIVVPWGFPSLSGWYLRPKVKKFLVVGAGLAVIGDVVYWAVAALGLR